MKNLKRFDSSSIVFYGNDVEDSVTGGYFCKFSDVEKLIDEIKQGERSFWTNVIDSIKGSADRKLRRWQIAGLILFSWFLLTISIMILK